MLEKVTTAQRAALSTLVLLSLFALSVALLPFLAGERAGLLEDDSYFYAQIAFNSQRYGFFTFDGLSKTSGVHPFWAGLLSAVAHVVGIFTQDKGLHLGAYLAVWFWIVFETALRVGRSVLQVVVFWGIAVLTAPLMETALLSLVLVLLLQRLLTQRAADHLDPTIAALAFLVPLTRIDASPILVVWLAALWSHRSQRALLGVGLAGGIAAHFGVLLLFFDHPFTVSSVLKAGHLAQNLFDLGSLTKVGITVRAFLLVALSIWGASVIGAEKKRRLQLLALFGAPVAFSLGHVWVSNVRSWYFLPGYAFAYWAGTWASGAWSRDDSKDFSLPKTIAKSTHPRQAWRVLATLVLVLNVYKVYRFIPLNHVRVASFEFAAQARRLTAHGSRIYQIDGSGFTAYWIDRHLINGDGLVNTYDYARRLKEKSLFGYLEQTRVCYVITDAPLRQKQRFLVNKAGLKVRRADADEVLRSAAYGWSKNQNAHFVLWRLRASRCQAPKEAAKG